MIVAGEALIDLVPSDAAARGAPAGTAATAPALRPLPGGSPLNVAVGLARLGIPTRYLGRLSEDPFGALLRDRLGHERVDTSLTTSTAAPSTLAVVHVGPAGDADYRFYLDGTSAAEVDVPAALPPGPLHVSLGAIGLAHPAGKELSALLGREEGRRARSLDPNVRATSGTTPRLLDEAIGRVDVVKASEEDLRAVYTEEPERVAIRWLAAMRGPSLIVITRGSAGATAITRTGRVDVDAPRVEVVDTIGAGDAFTAGLLAALDAQGVLMPGGIETLGHDALHDAMRRAARNAAITCTRRGADPPRRDERSDQYGFARDA
jgi:fructokinase